MNEADWAELLAQVEEHGWNKVCFYLRGAGFDGDDLELTVQDIKFVDGLIVVELE